MWRSKRCTLCGVDSEQLCQRRRDRRRLMLSGCCGLSVGVDTKTGQKGVKIEWLLLMGDSIVLGWQVTAQVCTGYDVNMAIVNSDFSTREIDP